MHNKLLKERGFIMYFVISAKRIVATALAIIILTVFISCSNESKETIVTTTAEAIINESEKLYADNMPESMDFGGQKIRFITENEKRSIDIDEEESDTGDIINEAIWKRNKAIESRLNVEIELNKVSGMGKLSSDAAIFIQAGSDEYDIVVAHARFGINLAASGYMKNLDNVNYLDFTQSYWNQMYMDEIAYKDVHYWSTGDITIAYISTIYAMFVNSSLWEDIYTDKTIYEIVLDGNWTIDKLREYSSGTYIDINGNGVTDDEDTFGFVMQEGHVLNGMVFASGMNYSQRDSEGNITLDIDNENTVNIFNKLYNLMYESGNATYMLANTQYDTTARKMFTEDRLLFFAQTFGASENELLRAMETDYYIIPFPKYDEYQTNYIVNQYDGVPLYGIPITVSLDNLDAIGATMEALASMSSTMVNPVYYDLALKNKYSRDETSATMIDLIRNSITTDFVFTWGDSLKNIYELFYSNINNNAIVSAIAKNEESWQVNLDKLLENLESYIDM